MGNQPSTQGLDPLTSEDKDPGYEVEHVQRLQTR